MLQKSLSGLCEIEISNNRIGTPVLLNRCCVFALDLESMFLVQLLKRLLQLLQHGVIPGSCQTEAQGISSPGSIEASLMWPRNDGEPQCCTMSDWTCR